MLPLLSFTSYCGGGLLGCAITRCVVPSAYDVSRMIRYPGTIRVHRRVHPCAAGLNMCLSPPGCLPVEKSTGDSSTAIYCHPSRMIEGSRHPPPNLFRLWGNSLGPLVVNEYGFSFLQAKAIRGLEQVFVKTLVLKTMRIGCATRVIPRKVEW